MPETGFMREVAYLGVKGSVAAVGPTGFEVEGDLATVVTGDPLRLYWLPGLAPSATVQPLGGGFVDFRADLPADGATDSLYSIASVYGGTITFPGSVPATIATDPHGEDPDGDQMGDLLEFAMGLDIYQSTTPDQPLVSLVNCGVDLSFDFALRDEHSGRCNDQAITS